MSALAILTLMQAPAKCLGRANWQHSCNQDSFKAIQKQRREFLPLFLDGLHDTATLPFPSLPEPQVGLGSLTRPSAVVLIQLCIGMSGRCLSILPRSFSRQTSGKVDVERFFPTFFSFYKIPCADSFFTFQTCVSPLSRADKTQHPMSFTQCKGENSADAVSLFPPSPP